MVVHGQHGRALRVGIVGLMQESNTFVEGRTTIDHFRQDMLLEGEAIRDVMVDSQHEVAGFFDGLLEADIGAVPIFFARALPFGVIVAADFDLLVESLLDGIRSAGPLDGILAAAHGATVAANCADADGYWLEAVRSLVGPDIPVVTTIDPHANLSQRMVDSTDAIIAYGTNPHVDQRITGRRAADLMTRCLRDDVRLTQSAAFPRLAINIQSQHTAAQPLATLYARASLCADAALSHSIVVGFPYADVPEMGSSTIVVTNSDPDAARAIATEIADAMYAMRRQFEPQYIDATDAVRDAAASASGPVVLLDMGDNVGGGSPANGMELLHAMHCGPSVPAFACVYDPDAVRRADLVGTGGRISGLGLGDPANPLHADFRVRSVGDGKFGEPEARHGGFSHFDQGRTAVLEIVDSRITVMVTSRRMPPFSLNQLTSFGINPSDYQMIVAKGVIAPIAAYEGIAERFVHVNTAGVTCAEMQRLDYRNRRRPMFPFEDDDVV